MSTDCPVLEKARVSHPEKRHNYKDISNIMHSVGLFFSCDSEVAVSLKSLSEAVCF